MHHWERSVFGGDAEGVAKANITHKGFWWSNGRPFFVTGAEGTDQHGKPFHWSARRHRFKRHLKHHIQAQDSKVAQREFHWWKWLRFWQFCNDPDAALAYWSSWAFILGGIVFAISGLSGGIESVNCEGCLFAALGEVAECQGLVGCAVCMCNGNVDNTATDGKWSSYSWLVCYTSIAGTDLFFLPGVLMVLTQTGNSHYQSNMKEWLANGGKGPKPCYNWFLPLDIHNLMSVGSWIMLSGKLCFSTAFTAFGISTSVPMSIPLQRWLIWVPGTYGSMCFALFGAFQCWEASHSLYKAIVPLFPETIGVLGCWAGSTGFWGGVWFTFGSAGFLGTQGINKIPSYPTTALYNVVGFFLGSVFFILNGWLSLLEVSNPGIA